VLSLLTRHERLRQEPCQFVPETRRTNCVGSCFLTALCFFVLVSAKHSHAEENAIDWRTGKEFRSQLESMIGFQWESSPIREGLRGLSDNQRIAIWLDRRVDPNHLMDLTVNNVTLDSALRQVGESIGGGVSYIGAVAYIGSKPVTAKLATLAALRRDEVKGLPSAARSRFSTKSVSAWKELSTPRELFRQLAQTARARVINIEQIPHDLWPARSLPTMSLTDRMTLLLAGFDMTFEIARDGSAIRLVPIPTEVSIERRYSPNGSLNVASAKLSATFPAIDIKKAGARLVVRGTFEQHEAIGRLLRGETTRHSEPIDPNSKRFDLRVDNQPIGAIIKAVAGREMLEVQIAPTVQEKLQQRVSFDVKQLTLEQLFEKTLNGAGIMFRIDDGVLILQTD
jgi:hypothetical protein